MIKNACGGQAFFNCIKKIVIFLAKILVFSCKMYYNISVEKFTKEQK